ncbi:hypothetical protein BS47DRAFT_1316884 [Hydnum rufescens UP504]|uniref:Pheromone receptor n=1 Tax=Hydnum rufescens UP504 TaxID=1448309 RepID=A0A9P6AZ53_9AGAM|nr:hypothetical protein BS47DRAFT_1316884 [Hydnum rufescens UP504]
MAADDTAFIFFASLALVLVLLPLPWHWNARNYGTLLYIAWTFVGNLVYFVNAIVWRGNLENPAPVWCDISTKLCIGVGVALPAVSLCINRRLYNIASTTYANSSPRTKLIQTVIDLSIGLGIPCVVMALHYIVQGHRYDIVENVGCLPTTYPTLPAIPLVFMWAPLLGLISMVYSILSILAFMKQRRNFKAILQSRNSHLNLSQYVRLMALAGTDLIFDIPLSIFLLWSNVHSGLQPWISFSNTHYGFSTVDYWPAATIKAIPGAWAGITINRWALPLAGFLFFFFFGLSGESLAFYKGVCTQGAKVFRTVRPRAKIPSSFPDSPITSVECNTGCPCQG